MSESTTRKKRAREETTTLSLSSPKRARSNTLLFSQQHHIETLQTELDHERSLRLLDERRAHQTQESLQRQLEFAVQQAERYKSLLEQERTASETIVSSLKEKNEQALRELRQCQIELEEERGEHEELNDSLEEERVWEEKARHLQETLQASAATETALKQELQELQVLLEQYQQQQKSTTETAEDDILAGRHIIEEAPPALLKELNRVRIQLAESERSGRQLQRRVQELLKQNKTLIREREEAKIASQRLVRVDKQLQDLQKEYERVVAETKSWTDLKQSLAEQLQRQGLVSYKTSDGGGVAGPAPEIATILRFMDQAQSRAEEMERERKAQQEECQRVKTSLLQTEAELKTAHENMEQAAQERRDLESKLRASKKQVATLEAQQTIYQRETQSLRSLIQTFDDMPLASKSTTQKDDVLASPKLDTSLKTMQVSLDSTRQELQLVKENRDTLSKELEESNKRQQEQQEELERVREKFGKLKEALYAEREKVERAQERANQAESLAGMGSFNPETTRALHMKETPLTEALKEEIKILKRQLEVAKGDKPTAKLAGGTAAADPEKLNQRLKENFKEQIALFREGVYLMTGYKVDMLPGTDRPTFRVRSVFAEREEDHLMLKWPKRSEEVTSLDILNTDFAKELTTTPSYTYMTKFHSLPAFLASVQLSLFEKQTVLM